MSETQTEWLRHPLVSMVLGFVLTGIVGTAITQHFLDHREQEKLRAQVAADRKQAIQQFSKLSQARNVRAEMMLKALRSDADGDELASFKQEYDKAYVEWSIERQSILLLFRDLLSAESAKLIEKNVTQSLGENIVNPIRNCLTDAIDKADDRATVKQIFLSCQIDELLDRSSACSLALAKAVSDLAGKHSEWISKEDKAVAREEARDSIGKQCL
jgi:hypothetical protein